MVGQASRHSVSQSMGRSVSQPFSLLTEGRVELINGEEGILIQVVEGDDVLETTDLRQETNALAIKLLTRIELQQLKTKVRVEVKVSKKVVCSQLAPCNVL